MTSEPQVPSSAISDEPEQIRVRKEKLDRLKAKGVEPYPVGLSPELAAAPGAV